jgi:putative DNA-invertase from lambdoid prophage Rac
MRPWGAGYSVQNLGGKSGQVRVAIYARVSTKDQNCDRQIADLENYAQLANYQVVATHAEKASGAKNDRAERKMVINLAQSRKIDAVLVTELSRWGRSTIDLMNTLKDLQSYGVSVIAQTGMTFDLSTPTGTMIASIMSSLAEFEKNLIRERVQSGVNRARAKGKVFGRRAGVGKIANSCDRINQLREQNMSDRAIAKVVGLSKSAIGLCPRCPDIPEGLDF